MKSLYIVCDKDGNPFFTDKKGADMYTRTWAFKNAEEAKLSVKGSDKVVEYRPAKSK